MFFSEAKTKLQACIVAYSLGATVCRTAKEFDQKLEELGARYGDVYLIADDEGYRVIHTHINPTVLLFDGEKVYKVNLYYSFLTGRLADLDLKLNDIVYEIGVDRILMMDYQEIVEHLYEKEDDGDVLRG